MFTNSINSNHKISQYYLSINNNHTFPIYSSLTSLSSVSSSLLTQSRNKFKATKNRKICKRIDSFSSLSTTSISPSITIVLHTKKTKSFIKDRSRNHKSNSSSSISLHQKNITKGQKGLNTTQHVLSARYHNKNIISRQESYRIFEEEQTRSFHSHSISGLNNIILTKINNNEIQLSTVSTQTDNYSSIQIEYQYENLRRVNSNLLDYMFIPTSNINRYLS
ncbi:unnamed protein product [Adineta steineri]|uniref:Uncharacterized protein n=1 Tax=Adineta steineri TaxID=433720 RepID=A0A815CD95_9BILA|nr:unnamed protein product [Adineta steineri]CAF3536019.1 unnamed protein product [Adineta steineri]